MTLFFTKPYFPHTMVLFGARKVNKKIVNISGKLWQKSKFIYGMKTRARGLSFNEKPELENFMLYSRFSTLRTYTYVYMNSNLHSIGCRVTTSTATTFKYAR